MFPIHFLPVLVSFFSHESNGRVIQGDGRLEASLTTGEIRQSVKHTIGELCLFLTAS